MDVKSYHKVKQQPSQLSLPFDFRIKCNQYQMSSTKSNAVPNEVIIGYDRKNAQPSIVIVEKDTIFFFKKCFSSIYH